MTKNEVKIDMNKPRIVCAAIRSRIGNIITSARHYDHNIHQQIKAMKDPEEFYHLYADNQGFIDQIFESLFCVDVLKVLLVALSQ